MSHLKKIVFPHLKKKKEELGLPMAAKSLLIFDVFRGQTTPKVLNFLKENHCMTVFVPNNHTDLFHPLDISVNKGAKSFLCEKYQEWEVPRVGRKRSR